MTDAKKVQEVIETLEGRHKEWITQFAEGINMSFDRLIAELDDAVENGGDSIHTGDQETDFPPELWEHYQAIRLAPVSEEVKQNTWFSCAC